MLTVRRIRINILKNGHSITSNLQIPCNPHQNSRVILHRQKKNPNPMFQYLILYCLAMVLFCYFLIVRTTELGKYPF